MMLTQTHTRGRRPSTPLDWRARLRQPAPLVGATIGQLTELFERKAVELGWARRTLQTLGSVLGMVRRDFGGLPIADAEPAWFAAWIEARRAGKHAPKTIRRDLSFLRAMFDHALELRLAKHNPIVNLPRRAIPKNRALEPIRAALEVLAPREIRRLLRSIRIPFERRCLWAVLLWTGVRISEAAGLSWGDYNPRRRPLGELAVRCQWDQDVKALVPTKVELARYVPVSRELAGWLAEALASFRRRRRRAPDPSEVLVPYRAERRGGEWRRWNPDTALDWWRRDLEAAGIEHPTSGPRRLHATRHTFATQAVLAGADWRAVATITHNPDDAEWAGCSFGQYVHVNWPHLCAAVRKLRF